jgi:hypothetical protein
MELADDARPVVDELGHYRLLEAEAEGAVA